MARRAMVTCSPVDTSMSSSRGSGWAWMPFASAISRLVSPDMAESTTTTWWPSILNLATRSATARMRSTLATEVPPYFCTMRAILGARNQGLGTETGDFKGLPLEKRDRLDMGRMREHIGDAGGLEAVALDMHQHLGIARQRRGITRDVDDTLRCAGFGKRFDHFDGTGARRVDQQLVEMPQCGEFLRCHVEQVVDCEADVGQLVAQRVLSRTRDQFRRSEERRV